MTKDETPELRELKKQTRMMAEKEAAGAAAGGCFISGLAIIGFAVGLPAWAEAVPWWGYVGFIVAIMVLCWKGVYDEYTRDR